MQIKKSIGNQNLVQLPARGKSAKQIFMTSIQMVKMIHALLFMSVLALRVMCYVTYGSCAYVRSIFT